MKNKKTFIAIGLVVAVLLMGIAYAGITNVILPITGTANVAVDSGNFSVGFSTDPADISTTKSVDSAAVTANVTNEKEATIAVSGLSTIGQYVTATYTIENNSDILDAELTAVADWLSADDTQDWFTVEYDFADGETTIAAGDKTTITVKVTLKKTPITDADVDDASAEIGVVVTAAPVQPESSGSQN